MSKTNMNLKERYLKEVIPFFLKEQKISNIFAVPKISKIIVNVGLGEALKDKSIIEKMSEQLALITGQKPKVTKAKKAVSAFKLRIGVPIGLKITLRGKRMVDFLEKIIAIVLPRVRDFRGLSQKSFDGKGNYSIGFSELTVFPEVKYESLDKIRGLEVTIVTNTKDDKMGRLLLEKLGLPLEK